MKKILIIFAGLTLCTWLTSCYTTQNVLLSSQELKDIYVGKTKKQLIQMMGPPTREVSDGDDGTILVYEENVGSTTKVTTTKVSNSYYSKYNTTSQENYSWFYLDSQGNCTYVKTNCLTKRAKAYNQGATVVLVTLTSSIVLLTALLLAIGK